MVIAVTVTTLLTVVTHQLLYVKFFVTYIAVYWLHVIYTVVSPVLYLGVIFIPKASLCTINPIAKSQQARGTKII